MSAARVAGACCTLPGKPRRFLPQTAQPTRSKEVHQPLSKDVLPAQVSKAINRGSQRRLSDSWLSLASVNTIVQNAEPLRQDSGGASRKNTMVPRCEHRRISWPLYRHGGSYKLLLRVTVIPSTLGLRQESKGGRSLDGAPSKGTLTAGLFMPFQSMTVVPSTVGERSQESKGGDQAGAGAHTKKY